MSSNLNASLNKELDYFGCGAHRNWIVARALCVSVVSQTKACSMAAVPDVVAVELKIGINFLPFVTQDFCTFLKEKIRVFEWWSGAAVQS